jgi:hypothetical protein
MLMTMDCEPGANAKREALPMLAELAREYEKNSYWMDHLLWLLENKPQFVRRLFFKDREKLRMYLSQKVEQAMNLSYNLQEKGLPRNEIDEIVAAQVLSPPPPEDEPEQLQESLKSSIIKWADDLSESKDSDLEMLTEDNN